MRGNAKAAASTTRHFPERRCGTTFDDQGLIPDAPAVSFGATPSRVFWQHVPSRSDSTTVEFDAELDGAHRLHVMRALRRDHLSISCLEATNI